MQICNVLLNKKISSKTRKFLLLSGIALLNCQLSFLHCQSMPKMPDFPEITPPSIGGGFYTPKIPDFPKKPAAPESTKKPQAKAEAELKDPENSQDLISEFLSPSNLLTANDISSLSDSGLFTGLSALNRTSGNNSDDTLKQILSDLAELKAESRKNSAPGPETQGNSGKILELNERKPSLLRFKINGYDMLDSLTKIYFSEPENDGSFLLTADRRYIAGNKIRNETFYILFTTSEGHGKSVTYNAEMTLAQDSKNENSFLYKLAEKKNLTAQKTGNLVVLRAESKDCTADLLLDLDI